MSKKNCLNNSGHELLEISLGNCDLKTWIGKIKVNYKCDWCGSLPYELVFQFRRKCYYFILYKIEKELTSIIYKDGREEEIYDNINETNYKKLFEFFKEGGVINTLINGWDKPVKSEDSHNHNVFVEYPTDTLISTFLKKIKPKAKCNGCGGLPYDIIVHQDKKVYNFCLYRIETETISTICKDGREENIRGEVLNMTDYEKLYNYIKDGYVIICYSKEDTNTVQNA
jgi:hypothetical protein